MAMEVTLNEPKYSAVPRLVEARSLVEEAVAGYGCRQITCALPLCDSGIFVASVFADHVANRESPYLVRNVRECAAQIHFAAINGQHGFLKGRACLRKAVAHRIHNAMSAVASVSARAYCKNPCTFSYTLRILMPMVMEAVALARATLSQSPVMTALYNVFVTTVVIFWSAGIARSTTSLPNMVFVDALRGGVFRMRMITMS